MLEAAASVKLRESEPSAMEGFSFPAHQPEPA